MDDWSREMGDAPRPFNEWAPEEQCGFFEFAKDEFTWAIENWAPHLTSDDGSHSEGDEGEERRHIGTLFEELFGHVE